MSRFFRPSGSLLAGLCLCGLAHADLVGTLAGSPLSAPGNVSFHNDNVQVGTISTSGAGVTYNFLDQWQFSLSPSLANVAALVASINFTAGAGGPQLFGISNLQVNLVSNPVSGPPLVSWLTVTSPVAGLQQQVALIPSSTLAAGNYTLQVRGTVALPGAYSGSLIVDAVPLPATLPLLLAGVSVIGWLGRRFSGRREDGLQMPRM